MDKQNEQTKLNQVSTKASAERGVFLTAKDAEEFRAYKRRIKMTEAAVAITRSQSSLLNGEDVQRVCERAVKLKQAAIRLPLSKLTQAKYYLAGSEVKIDCIVGGDGETLPKVMAYEARTARRRGAKEITVPVTPSLLDCCRYGEIRKQIKRVKRASGKAAVKVRLEKTGSPTALARVARLASELGAKYFSVPYFKGCERLRLDLTNGCLLETTGVETVGEFKSLTEIGVGRIVTERAWEIYAEWLKEASETPLPTEGREIKAEEKTTKLSTAEKVLTEKLSERPQNPETDYHCKLEGSDLKFL